MAWRQAEHSGGVAVDGEGPAPRYGVDMTERQAEVLDFIAGHYRRTGVPPTVRDIMAHFGFSAPNGAMCHLRALVKKGFLDHAGGARSHAYMPAVPAGHCPCCGQRKGD